VCIYTKFLVRVQGARCELSRTRAAPNSWCHSVHKQGIRRSPQASVRGGARIIRRCTPSRTAACECGGGCAPHLFLAGWPTSWPYEAAISLSSCSALGRKGGVVTAAAGAHAAGSAVEAGHFGQLVYRKTSHVVTWPRACHAHVDLCSCGVF
jgi:hypothetical protein